jgi:hypothetical protein
MFQEAALVGDAIPQETDLRGRRRLAGSTGSPNACHRIVLSDPVPESGGNQGRDAEGSDE